ncbi:helix-turn-helix domain-containing protein [Dactylosporangium sp. AC04546]|uniref:TetR/AcrR family transcriptional regulator n=1 Tax=Dactylosporangium sp. AC04546 TaxID=2862460 RepID=UPI001EDF6516|nr:TetR/AcrR family transcriptional regulator [Dactylosporangium sp. AC04546]WVK82097.1 helix-turn-helix domain-containing protein [Dactylosporangium sp. AC04546]
MAATAEQGRKGQARRNDTVILEAAREVFLDDPKAPIAAVADRAGVGISALYRRYAGKEDLLRTLCHDGLKRFSQEADDAGRAHEDGWAALRAFLEGVVDADVHSLTVHLAGTFTPTEEMRADAVAANGLVEALVERAHGSGRLRRDFTAADVGLVLEACAAIRLPDRDRTAQLRRRYLGLTLDGMDRTDTGALPGPAPVPGEFNYRWRTSR